MTVALLAGSTVWALIVGTICGIVATGDPHATEFKQKMDELNYFMTDMNIDQTLRVRAREYYRQTRDLRKKLSYTDLIDRLSPTLRGEVVLQMSKKTLETVWYLRACEPYFLVELALVMVRGLSSFAGSPSRSSVPPLHTTPQPSQWCAPPHPSPPPTCRCARATRRARRSRRRSSTS